VVTQMPEHRRAQNGAERVREKADAERRHQRGQDLLANAQAALRERRYARCLEIIEEAVAFGVPAEVAAELTSLREKVVAEQEAVRRQQQEAEAASSQATTAQAAARDEDAEHYAPAAWNEAQRLASAAEAHLRQAAYAEAKQAFDRAAAGYQRALDAARQAQDEERRTAERSR